MYDVPELIRHNIFSYGRKKMIFRILARDLKRKKSVNLILFVFIIIASMLMAGSANVLYMTSAAINRMIVEANIGDLTIIAFDKEDVSKKIDEWAAGSELMESYAKDDAMLFMMECLERGGKVIVDDQDAGTSFLIPVPEENGLLFDQNNQKLKLSAGEMALPMNFHKKYDINIGDTIDIRADGEVRSFRVAKYTKDIILGSDMNSSKRFALSKEDYYSYVTQDSGELKPVGFWTVNGKPGVTYLALAGQLGNQAIDTLFFLGTDDIVRSYFVAQLVAAVMIIVSASLILIAFLILRFTIVYTIQEDYRSIGVMKGIGIRSRSVRKIYLIKYLALALVAGVIGFGLSFIYSRVMLRSMEDLFLTNINKLGFIFAILGSAGVIVISMFFCMACTRKINKVSVVEAIRMGNAGERFSKSKKISLSRKKHLRSSEFMAISDLLNGFKKYAVLAVTFLIGTLLIIIPLNTINTLKNKDEMIKMMGSPPNDAFVISKEMYRCSLSGDEEGIEREMIRVEGLFENEGYPIKLYVDKGISATFYANNEEETINGMILQVKEYDLNLCPLVSGTAPMLANEAAVSSKIAETFGISLGDTISVRRSDSIYHFVITAIYQSMMNNGDHIRVSELLDLGADGLSSVNIFGLFDNRPVDIGAVIEEMKSKYPELTISTGYDTYDRYIGGTVEVVDGMKNLIVAVMLGIIFLITGLVVRLLISRETSEIALLKSIGFRNAALRRWQVVRIAIVLIFSIVIGTLVAGPVGGVLINSIFGSLGVSRITQVINPMEVYLIYPAILLLSTVLAVMVSVGQIEKTKVEQINNQE
jgi:putative ABC transport system permease protein